MQSKPNVKIAETRVRSATLIRIVRNRNLSYAAHSLSRSSSILKRVITCTFQFWKNYVRNFFTLAHRSESWYGLVWRSGLPFHLTVISSIFLWILTMINHRYSLFFLCCGPLTWCFQYRYVLAMEKRIRIRLVKFDNKQKELMQFTHLKPFHSSLWQLLIRRHQIMPIYFQLECDDHDMAIISNYHVNIQSSWMSIFGLRS